MPIYRLIDADGYYGQLTTDRAIYKVRQALGKIGILAERYQHNAAVGQLSKFYGKKQWKEKQKEKVRKC